MNSNKLRVRNTFLPTFLGILSLTLLTSTFVFTGLHSATAAWKPTKTVKIVVPSREGGSLDRLARLLRKIMQEEGLVKKVTLVNKKGGGHRKALTFLSKKKGDAHYIQVEAPTMFGKHILGKSPFSYDSVTPLAQLYEEYICVGVPPASKLKKAMDIVKILKKNPGALSIGFASSPGAASHIGIAMPLRALGVDVTKLKTVIYSGGGKANAAVMGGHVDFGTSTHVSMGKKRKGGKMRILACSSPVRLSKNMKGVPTWKELGADIEFANFRTVVGPLGLSKAQVAFWDKTFAKIIKTKTWKNKIKNGGERMTYMNSVDATKDFKKKFFDVKKILTDLGLSKI